MRREHFARTGTGPRRQRDGLLFTAVHAIDNLELADAVVVGGFGFDQDFVDTCWSQIATRLPDPHRWRGILQGVDRIFDGSPNDRTIRRRQLDAIETVAPHGESRRHRGIVEPFQPHGVARIEHQRATRHRARRVHPQQRGCATGRSNVTTIVRDIRRQVHIRRIAQLDADARHPWQVFHRQVPQHRPHAA